MALPVLTLLAAAYLLCLLVGASGITLVARTSLGKINGIFCDNDVSDVASFRGIPYAQPPIGRLRWAAPVKYSKEYPFDGLDALSPGPKCRQGTEGDEDCLFLNVWTPAKAIGAPKPKLPVRVFIHGGGYQTGAGSEDIYDGCKLVQDGNVVFVTMNYRLGILGFMASPELRDNTADFRVGNWGLLDQRLALQWVRDNIAAFGGDPKKVVLSGESAGAYSTLLHLVAPASRGLFSAAASFSGSADAMAVDFLKDAYTKGTNIRAALNCSIGNIAARGYATIPDCLRDTDADVIMAVQTALSSRTVDYCVPTIDGVELIKHPVLLMEQGRVSKVPVLLGVNANEGALEVLAQTGDSKNIDLRRFFEVVTNLLPVPVTSFTRVFEQYNADAFFDGNWIVAAFHAVTDGGYHCPSRRAAKSLAKYGIPVRYHILEASLPNSGCPVYVTTGVYLGQEITDFIGALHTYDIPFTFMAPYRSPYSLCPFTDDEKQLASFLSGIINGMAANRNGTPLPPRTKSLTSPTLADIPSWPVWNTSSNLVMDINTGGPSLNAAEDIGLDAKCQLWDDLLAGAIAVGTTAYT
ncbi:hypothetical protein Vafri_17822 [Volvox africanus]|uniref:Carboxylic ester hydrolase n=1 Tax=Volvox africanus TaxID=51714 RepID=A0A8J4F7U9_9CHLO|nr:hypothetical protein Vafri_17822 [Volvox africanus]